MSTIEVPKEYAYVIAVNGVGSLFALGYLGGQVMKARKEYSVEYPNLYAVPGVHKDAEKFNYVQRGHQQALETYPSFLALSLIGGLKHPVIVAAGGAAWIIGRVQYMEGYKEGAGKRMSKGGGLYTFGILAGVGASLSVAYSLLKSK